MFKASGELSFGRDTGALIPITSPIALTDGEVHSSSKKLVLFL